MITETTETGFLLTPEFEDERKRLKTYIPGKNKKPVTTSRTGYRLLNLLSEDLPGSKIPCLPSCCPSCGTTEPYKESCRACGTDLTQETLTSYQDKRCHTCKTWVKPTSTCPSCGSVAPHAPEEIPLVPLPQDLPFPALPHQEKAIQALLSFDHHGLFMDPGLGKTFTYLMAIHHLWKHQGCTRFVVVCPKSVIPTWLKPFFIVQPVPVKDEQGNPVLNEDGEPVVTGLTLNGRSFEPGETVTLSTIWPELKIMGLGDSDIFSRGHQICWKVPGKGRGEFINNVWYLAGRPCSEACPYPNPETQNLGQPVLLVTNYESLRHGSDAVDSLVKEKLLWDAICLDESVKIKETDTLIYRGLMEVRHLFRRRYLATGIPAPQSVADYAGQAAFLHPVYFGYSTRRAFEKDNGWVDGYAKGKVRWKHDRLKWIHARVHKIATVIRTEDTDLKLPEKSYKRYYVQMTPEQQRHHDDLSSKFVTYIETVKAQHGGHLTGAQLAVITPNILSQITRLTQLTGGFICGLRDPRVILAPWENAEDAPCLPPQSLPDGNPKLELLCNEILEEFEKPLVIVAKFKEEIKVIDEAFKLRDLKGRVIQGDVPLHERSEIEDQFRAKELDYIILQSETGKYGLNLQTSHNIIFYSNSYSFDSRGQSEKRVHRIGQTHNVTIVDILCSNSIDSTVLAALNKKRSISELILSNPRAIQDEDVYVGIES